MPLRDVVFPSWFSFRFSQAVKRHPASQLIRSLRDSLSQFLSLLCIARRFDYHFREIIIRDVSPCVASPHSLYALF